MLAACSGGSAATPGATATKCSRILDATAAPSPASPFAKACALQRSGYTDDAAAELEKAVQDNPRAPVPSDLKRLQPGGLGLWREFRHRWQPWLIDVGQAAATVVGGATAVFILLCVLPLLLLRATLGRSTRLRKAVHLGRPILVPDLSPGDRRGPDAPSRPQRMMERVRDELGKVSSAAGGGSNKFVDSATEPDAVPKLAELSPDLKFVDAALAALQRSAPRYIVKVALLMHPPGRSGVGMTVTLTGHTGQVRNATTLWEEDFDPPIGGRASRDPNALDDRYDLLAAPAAVWIFYDMSETDKDPPLGTRNWMSYAKFSAGVRRLRDAPSKARRLFSDALMLDAANLGARLNLASLNLSGPDVADRKSRAESTLGAVKQEIEQRAASRYKALRRCRPRFERTESYRWDVYWYRAAYVLAARLSNHYYSQPRVNFLPPEDEHLTRAVASTVQLVAAIEHTLSDVAGRRSRWATLRRRVVHPRLAPKVRQDDEALRQLLERLEPTAVALLATLKARTAIGVFQVVEGDQPPGRAERRALGVANAEHEALSRFVGPFARLSRAASYNVACYLSELGCRAQSENAEEQARALFRRALELIAVWLEVEPQSPVNTDPNLFGVRTVLADELATLVKSSSMPQPAIASRTSVRDHMALVGKATSEKLAREGVRDKGQLVAQAGPRAAREALAQRCQLEESLLRRWALLADLLDQIETADEPETVPAGCATLLDQAGTDSIAALQAADPIALSRVLAQLNDDAGVLSWGPSEITVRRWHEKARVAVPRVD